MPRIPGLIVLTVLALTLLTASLPAGAQQVDAGGSEPQEYGEEEFSPFLRDLRRGEIVMFGTFPITLFLTLEVFDIYRYIDNIGNPEQYRYTPWPFRAVNPFPYEPNEIKGILITAASASLLMAVADYIIGRVKEKRSER
jgi:hypothetical protein